MTLPMRFFQRGVVRFETKIDESGVAIIAAAYLTCGHRVPYKRRRPATSQRKTMPCPKCGAGPRTPWEHAREERDLERVIHHAAADDVACRALATVLRHVIDIVATAPCTEEQRRLWDQVEVPARACGLRDRDQGELHERGPRSLTRQQRDALVAFGCS